MSVLTRVDHTKSTRRPTKIGAGQEFVVSGITRLSLHSDCQIYTFREGGNCSRTDIDFYILLRHAGSVTSTKVLPKLAIAPLSSLLLASLASVQSNASPCTATPDQTS